MYFDNYPYLINDSFTETADKIKDLSNDDLILISNLKWKSSTYDKISNLLETIRWTKKDLLALSDDQKKRLSKIFQQDEILLDQFRKALERKKMANPSYPSEYF